MKLDRFCVRNFRRLENVEVNLSDTDTILVGPNNSGKTSASMIFRLFLPGRDSEFQIYDFSAPLLQKIDQIGEEEKEAKIPSIDLDLWFSINPETEYGKVYNLLTSLEKEYSEIGIRISFSVNDQTELISEFESSRKFSPDIKLSRFLSEKDRLKNYFSLKYFKLEKTGDSFSNSLTEAHALERDEGRRALRSLIAVDFVDAQRNIDDKETARSTRLSSILNEYYKANLEKLEADDEVFAVIDESNSKLSKHYDRQFNPLFDIISDLGFPSANDRKLRISSTLKPEDALQGNTTLLYADSKYPDYELPEAYNGLGFKNLIYIAAQISHFQRKWRAIEEIQPSCHLIFVEEPEVHLHTQVQQTFIRKIRKVIEGGNNQENNGLSNPQLLISTHSPHIIDEGDFTCIRYFQRCRSEIEKSDDRKIATKVLDLKDFSSKENSQENVNFLKKYLKLTHCDLFFSDGAVLVEGATEKLLMPKFIEKEASSLSSKYLTILEVGGAYAHRLVPLIKFLNLPALIISDLDSIDPQKNRKACMACQPGAVSSNKTITSLVNKKAISDLLKISNEEPYLHISPKQEDLGIAFQNSISPYSGEQKMIPRTFEESFIYHNLDSIRKNSFLSDFIELDGEENLAEDYKKVYSTVRSPNYKKTEFALEVIDSDVGWVTPQYISKGLQWLVSVMDNPSS